MSIGMPLIDRASRRTRVVEGLGVSRSVGRYCSERGYRRVLVITDKTVKRLGLTDNVISGIEKENISWSIFDDIGAEPRHSTVVSAAEAGARFGADCVVAVGGGSVMDCAKIACIGIRNPGMTERRLTHLQLGKRPGTTPLITVPTTAGTGAEVTVGSVLVDDKSHSKHCAGGPKVKAQLCVLDGEMTVNCPLHLTASSGIDALSHGIEAFLGRVRLPEEREKEILQCIKLAVKNLPVVLREPQNKEARLKMSRAAYLGGLAINMCTAGYCHSFAHVLGALYNIPHGEAVAVTLPVAMRYQMDACREKLARMAHECGIGDENDTDVDLAEMFVEKIEGIINESGLSTACESIKKEDYALITRRAFRDSVLMIPSKVMRKSEAGSFLDACASNRNAQARFIPTEFCGKI